MLQSAARRRTTVSDFGVGMKPSIMTRLRGLRRRTVLAGIGVAILTAVIGGYFVVSATSTAPATVDAQTGSAAESATATGPAASAARRRPTVVVRTGAIAATADLEGRVAGASETVVTFQSVGQVKAAPVTLGQVVQSGQLLVELDATQIQQALDEASSRLESSKLRLQQAEAQARVREREERSRIQAQLDQAEATLRQAQAEQARIAAGAPAVDRQQAESAVTMAQAELRRAESELARMRAGAPAAELRAAEQQVASARLAQQRAEAAQARLIAGPDPVSVRAAQQQVAQAKVALRRAEEDQARIAAGPDQAELRTAEREVLSAQSAVVRAQAELDRVSRPDPVALAAADRDVQRAEVSLRAAKATKPTKETKVAQQAAVISAELSLQDARARRDQLRAGPPPAEVEVARHNLAAARAALDDARLRLETIRQGPPQLVVDGANVAVGVARSDLEEAEARLQTLTAGPPPDEVASADDAVATARSAAESAQARYATLAAGPPPDQVAQASAAVTAARSALAVAVQRVEELRSHPTEDELRDAQARVEAATAAVSRAQAEAAAPPSAADDVSAYDRRLLTMTVEREQAQVDGLRQQLAATRIEAPFDGVVAQLKATVGGPADPASPAVVLAANGGSIVGAEISDTDGPRVATGQTASVAVGEGPPLSAEVESVAAGSTPNTRFVRLRVAWNGAVPTVGTPARATVITEQRNEALLVPKRAVRSSGQRRFVEVVDGNATKTVNVTEGISANGEVEILNGLTEGQFVVVGS